jgi:hypothetical protein
VNAARKVFGSVQRDQVVATNMIGAVCVSTLPDHSLPHTGSRCCSSYVRVLESYLPMRHTCAAALLSRITVVGQEVPVDPDDIAVCVPCEANEINTDH